MKNYLVISLLCLVGCATTPQIPVVVETPKTIEVPLISPCNVVMPTHETWEMDKVTPTDMFTRMEAALKEIEQRRVYEAHLEATLEYCINPHVNVELVETK